MMFTCLLSCVMMKQYGYPYNQYGYATDGTTGEMLE
jgi:hypothetical protein